MDFRSPFAGLVQFSISLIFMRLMALGKRTIWAESPLLAGHTQSNTSQVDIRLY